MFSSILVAKGNHWSDYIMGVTRSCFLALSWDLNEDGIAVVKCGENKTAIDCGTF